MYIKVLLGGKERGLNFSQMAWVEFLKKVDHDRWDTTCNYAMVWGGLVENHYRKNEPVEFTISDVIDWVDVLEKDALDQIAEKFQATQQFKKLIEATEKKEEKLTKKKPRNTVSKV
jgi:hypothetical protein